MHRLYPHVSIALWSPRDSGPRQRLIAKGGGDRPGERAGGNRTGLSFLAESLITRAFKQREQVSAYSRALCRGHVLRVERIRGRVIIGPLQYLYVLEKQGRCLRLALLRLGYQGAYDVLEVGIAGLAREGDGEAGYDRKAVEFGGCFAFGLSLSAPLSRYTSRLAGRHPSEGRIRTGLYGIAAIRPSPLGRRRRRRGVFVLSRHHS